MQGYGWDYEVQVGNGVRSIEQKSLVPRTWAASS